MPSAIWRWSVAGLLLIACGVATAMRWRDLVELRATRAAWQLHADDAEQLRAEKIRLEQSIPSQEELQKLEVDRAALRQLQDQAAARARELAPVEGTPTAPETSIALPGMIPLSELQNAGRATPRAAVETALWAAGGAEIDVLADALLFDANDPAGDAAQAAQTLFAGLPAAMREQYDTPERLISYLTIAAVPLGSMRIMTEHDDSPDDATVWVQLQDSEGQTKERWLHLRRSDRGWQMVVPFAAVNNYARSLLAKAPSRR